LAYPAGAASLPWETTLLRLIQYRSQPSQLNTHTAMAAHTDVGLITIGLRTAPGLQIRAAASEKWQNVESTLLCGQPILLVGETLRLLTGNALPSCVHRVSEIGADRLAWVYPLRMRADARVDFQALAGRQTGPINGALSNMTGAQMFQYLIERSGTHIT
jgi:isopenicillin N synthase-like dioxygenase